MTKVWRDRGGFWGAITEGREDGYPVRESDYSLQPGEIPADLVDALKRDGWPEPFVYAIPRD